MKKLWNYNKFKFINNNLIKEYSEFNQYQMGLDSSTSNPLGPTYGWSTDPGLSIYGTDQDSPYTDYYARTSGSVNRLNAISKSVFNDIDQSILRSKTDAFLDDIDNFNNYKILRIYLNDSLHLNIFISFYYDEEEFFGVFKNFNFGEPNLETEMYTDPRFMYIDKEYKLKMSIYFKKILNNWFLPKKNSYKNLKDNCPVKDTLGNIKYLKKNSIINIIGVDMEKDNSPYIIMKQNDNKYYLKDKNYYYFNYWFEKII
jgi:hypothetical protein